IKGEVANDKITVSHYVVNNSFTADEDIPQLSPRMFKKGESLLVFLNEDSRQSKSSTQKKYISEDANCGALIATKSTTSIVESFK
ncbi:MAG: hypothetical protein DYH05_08730, partial [Acidobacteria bacterium ACB1]|nr:hypothetical protein [Acidobacteria bacterium ACB1]